MELKEGYKMTDIGLIPEDWDAQKLQELAVFYNGKAHENFISSVGCFIVVNSKYISSDGKVLKYSTKNACELVKDDICIVMSDIPNGKALAKCFIIPVDHLYALNQRIGGIRSTKVAPKFLFYQLNRNPYYLAFDSGSGQTNLRKHEVLNCPVKTPRNYNEQTAIASALSDMDALVAQTEKLIEKK